MSTGEETSAAETASGGVHTGDANTTAESTTAESTTAESTTTPTTGEVQPTSTSAGSSTTGGDFAVCEVAGPDALFCASPHHCDIADRPFYLCVDGEKCNPPDPLDQGFWSGTARVPLDPGPGENSTPPGQEDLGVCAVMP